MKFDPTARNPIHTNGECEAMEPLPSNRPYFLALTDERSCNLLWFRVVKNQRRYDGCATDEKQIIKDAEEEKSCRSARSTTLGSLLRRSFSFLPANGFVSDV